ncbi:hypothetical protein JYU34_012341 [Plutella xylostella]|uniref:Secreted protein n=1 Tax=Plutella xylostella TaxID=51655 RepID=A0ABQ7QG52_PLUXY|nr:hypothetical protein JYU34_012341 [Plutella xylostella]
MGTCARSGWTSVRFAILRTVCQFEFIRSFESRGTESASRDSSGGNGGERHSVPGSRSVRTLVCGIISVPECILWNIEIYHL